MVTKRATIRNANGIHCRPSAVIINEVKPYRGKILLTAPAGEADLRSLLGLLSLCLEVRTEITIAVDGPDEAAMCNRLVELFETEFDFPPRK